MTLNAVARRYAGALFDVTEQRGTSVQAQASLSGVRAVIAEHPDLKHVLGSAAVTARQKRAILDAVLAKLPPLNQEVARLLTALADRDQNSRARRFVHCRRRDCARRQSRVRRQRDTPTREDEDTACDRSLTKAKASKARAGPRWGQRDDRP